MAEEAGHPSLKGKAMRTRKRSKLKVSRETLALLDSTRLAAVQGAGIAAGSVSCQGTCSCDCPEGGFDTARNLTD